MVLCFRVLHLTEFKNTLNKTELFDVQIRVARTRKSRTAVHVRGFDSSGSVSESLHARV